MARGDLNSANKRKSPFTSEGEEKKYLLTDEKQTALIISLIDNNFNISKSCVEVGISRAAYYYTLQWNEDFDKKLKWTKTMINNIVVNGILEGLTHSDLTLRYKYLDLMAKSGILSQAMEYNDTKSNITLNITKDDINIE